MSDDFEADNAVKGPQKISNIQALLNAAKSRSARKLYTAHTKQDITKTRGKPSLKTELLKRTKILPKHLKQPKAHPQKAPHGKT